MSIARKIIGEFFREESEYYEFGKIYYFKNFSPAKYARPHICPLASGFMAANGVRSVKLLRILFFISFCYYYFILLLLFFFSTINIFSLLVGALTKPVYLIGLDGKILLIKKLVL